MKKVKVWYLVFLSILMLPQFCLAAVAQPPIINSITPTNAIAGTITAIILGKNFSNPVSVTVYDATTQAQVTKATAKIKSGDQITATATLAAGSYYFKVTTSKGVSNSSPVLRVTKRLAPGPYPVTNLGSLVQMATLKNLYYYRTPATDEPHLLLYFMVTQTWKQPFQILDINLASGQSRVIDALLGAACPNATYLHTDGKLYIGSDDPGYAMVYDPSTGQTQQLPQLADKTAQWVVAGDDGAIYFGEAVKGYVESYHPNTGVWNNYGIMDDPGPPYYRYAYTLGADERYIYVGVGQNPWYLVTYDRQTGTQTTTWKDAQLISLLVKKGMDGYWYADLFDAAGHSYYKLNGNNVELQSTPPVLDPSRGPLSNFLSAGYPESFPYELDLGGAYPDTGNNGQTVIKWRLKGATAWQQTSAQLKIGAVDIKQLSLEKDSNTFLGFTSNYGPVFTYDPVSSQVNVLGYPQCSLYDALLDYTSSGYRYFFSGYAAATLKYDPTLPWNLTASVTDKFNSEINPTFLRLPPEGSAKYHYYLAKGADGNIYVGEHHERDSVGGSLGWYNPDTGEAGGLRDPFLQHDVRDLIALQNSRQLVFSGNSIQSGSDGKLFIFNVDLKQVVNSFVPLPGSQDPGKIIEVSPGVILGVAKGNTTSQIYKINLETGEVLFSNVAAGVAFGGMTYQNVRLIMGPDDYVWLYLNSDLYRVNPADGTLEKIVPAAPLGALAFYNNDLYIFGNGSCTLRRISQMFNP